MDMYIETIYEGNQLARSTVMGVLADGTVKELRCLNGQYSSAGGKVTSYIDPTIITADAVVKGQIKRLAQKACQGGNRSNRHSSIQHEYNRLLVLEEKRMA